MHTPHISWCASKGETHTVVCIKKEAYPYTKVRKHAHIHRDVHITMSQILTGILDCLRNVSNASKEPRVEDCTYTPLSER